MRDSVCFRMGWVCVQKSLWLFRPLFVSFTQQAFPGTDRCCAGLHGVLAVSYLNSDAGQQGQTSIRTLSQQIPILY